MNNSINIKYRVFSLSKIDFDSKCEIIRDGEFSLTHYATSDIENSLCFVENDGYLLKANRNRNITAIITTSEYEDRVEDKKGVIVTKNPKKLFFEIHNKLKTTYKFDSKNTIAETAKIHPTAIIGEGVVIGENTIIGAYCIIEDGTEIGDNVLIENHAIIGGRGMHNTKIDGNFFKVVDLGNVVVSDECEILSNAVIQKPYFYHSTIIGNQTRVSVGCNIGHGCKIGERGLIAGHSIIAGYCEIGKDVWIGPNSTISHMTKVNDYSSIMLGSVVIQDLKEGEYVSGNFAYDHVKNLKTFIKRKRD
jgi:UDP-3-O-[3-hydroxymyristoyl] glucosamine N-acyltransferase LpxD